MKILRKDVWALIMLSLLLQSSLICTTVQGIGDNDTSGDQQPQCTLDVINPTCGNGTQLPTAMDFPCITESYCLNSSAVQNGIVDCTGWICTLRLNCGCFAGQVTSCAANASSCDKSGCSMVVTMFEQSGCSYADFFGPRNSSQTYEEYLNQCLEGCPGSALVVQSTFTMFILVVTLLALFT